ncbi:MAG: AzlC family ABC transporter permease [Pseudomonadota bacterium]
MTAPRPASDLNATGASPNSTLRPDAETAPQWAATATRRYAVLRGLRVAGSTPGWVLFATSIGYGALARDADASLGLTMLLAGLLYALPAQVVFMDQLARDASLFAAMLAVMLTAIRLLPMTVSIVPYFRDDTQSRWLKVVAVHFVAITAWLEGRRRLPGLPVALRVPHFIGIGAGLALTTIVGAALGYLLAGSVPSVISAALLLLTPVYFILSLIGVAVRLGDWLAISAGAALGPVMFLAAPGLDLLLTGLVGGTAAWAIEKARQP